MIYCIVEGYTDKKILSFIIDKVFDKKSNINIIVTSGFHSIPAVVRTVMSFMESDDKVMIVCDQENFNNDIYSKNMLGFLLRGAMNNSSLKLFTFKPNIDILLHSNNIHKNDYERLKQEVNKNMDSIMKNETIKEILEFIKK